MEVLKLNTEHPYFYLLLMSPILYFWEASEFEPRELSSRRRAINLSTNLPSNLATHLHT
jgi:hypothetical protein